ncbi:MAG: hypothetical protein M0R50_06935 [Candidatus Cloacimonetes bacterium]|jgi:hypothetical protein|nr:hypothetical protein [Candidatus Cloacimonadota bacterium]
MSAQPANTSISVYRNVRSYRKALRHEAVAALTKRLRPLIMSVPGEEVLVGVLTRDTTVQDFSPYCGEARFGAGRGFPIVVGLYQIKTFGAAQEGLPGIDFAFQIGSDMFLANVHASLTRDLQGDLRNDTYVPPVNA